MFKVKIVAALLIVGLFMAIHLAAPEFLPEVFDLLSRVQFPANAFRERNRLSTRDNFFHSQHANLRDCAGHNLIGRGGDSRRLDKFYLAEIFFPQ